MHRLMDTDWAECLRNGRWRRVPAGLVMCAAGLSTVIAGGCGRIADKDRIVVARLNGEAITRGDLEEVLREMPDEDRPLIQNKGDLLQALNKYINDQIKIELAAELSAEGKIEVSRDVARAAYFEKHPEFRSAFLIRDPSALEMTEGDINAVKAEVEFGVDEQVELLMREAALAYRVQEAVRTGQVMISREELGREYELRKNGLVQFEFMEFIAIQFPVSMQGAVQEASNAARLLQEGKATFDDLLEKYIALDPKLAMRSAFENNPAKKKFRAFWEVASGQEVGATIGPVLLPDYDQVGLDENGRQVVRKMPSAFLVLEVVEHAPERPKTLEEAGPELAAMLARRKVLQMLRDERGVEVYEDKLPRPEGLGDQYKGQFIRTTG